MAENIRKAPQTCWFGASGKKGRSKMPRFVKRALLLLTVIALLLTSLCGCTGDTEPGGSDPVTAQSGELPPESGTPEPQRNSVTVGIATDVASLDPHYATTGDTRAVMFNMFEGLVKASPEGGVTCAVASDYTVSADGLTYTFTLREGVTFHNGEPVTAEDVVYSLKRAAGSENEGTPLISAFSNAKNIEADEAGHVVLTLNAPGLEFINSVASASIIPADSGATIANNPIGTGPFKFVSYAPADNLVMEKYDGYWGENAHLDRVTFRFIGDMNKMVMDLQGGTLDLVTKLPASYLSAVESSFTVLSDTMKLVVALYLNNDVEPLNDPLVRQAMYYAIDVDELNLFMCDGRGVPTGTSMYPAQKRYFIPELAKTYSHDVEEAKALLTQAGWPDGFDLTVIAPSDYDQYVQGAEVLAEQLKQIGVNVKVELTPFDNWTAEVYRGREFEATICAIASNDMSAREMLERYTSDATKNFINFSDEEFDRVVAQAKATLDPEEQIALYKRAEEILNEQAASLWLMDMNELVVLNPELDGYTFYCTYVLDLSTVYYK